MASLLDHAKFSVVAYELENFPVGDYISEHKPDDFKFKLPSDWELTKVHNDQPTLTGNESNFAAGIFRNEVSNTRVFTQR